MAGRRREAHALAGDGRHDDPGPGALPFAGPCATRKAAETEGSLALDRITRRFPVLERFFADAGCKSARVSEAAPWPVEIIRRSGAGFVLQPQPCIVERIFARIGNNRRLARDFERFAETAKTLSQIARIKLMARRIARCRDFRVRR